uniref:Uncharacterized protein n=1 Tax=Glossina pallidipes TaxID=7398 RepID=A0A1A9ZZ32_GLOPL
MERNITGATADLLSNFKLSQNCSRYKKVSACFHGRKKCQGGTANSGRYSEFMEPGNPGGPSIPGSPGRPSKPRGPKEPGSPGSPGSPFNPSRPSRPSFPGIPGGPGGPLNRIYKQQQAVRNILNAKRFLSVTQFAAIIIKDVKCKHSLSEKSDY